MDASVPTGAALLLDFIGNTEAPHGYDTVYGNNQRKLKQPLTSMTLGAIVDAQKSWSKNFGSSAAGRYQFMRATLQGLAKELSLSGTQIFNGDFQDRLAFHLLKRRGYQEYMAGKINSVEFGRRLAQEWASFPVLADCQGAHRSIKRGQSFYAGDGLNKSLITPEQVEAVLMKVRKAPDAPQKPAESVPAPAPSPIPPEPEVVPAPVPVPPVVVPKQSSIGAFIKAVLSFFASFLKRK